MITNFEQLMDALKTRPKKKIVAAFANDSHTISAVSAAVDKGFVEGVLVGDEATIKKVCKEEGIDSTKFHVVQEADETKACGRAVELINNGEGDILMKGLCSTDKYMRAILNKENGLLPPKAVLSHVTVLSVSTYPKLLVVGDVAVIPAPDINQKVAITNYLISVAKSLGIDKPKVAILAATEQMLPNMPACIDAAMIAKMADRGQIKGAFVDGPMAVDVAIDKESAETKKVSGPVAGDADCMVFPNIESGNIFFKAVTKLAGGELAAMVMGAKAPCVLTSRGDSTTSKLYSIALAALSVK